jgi:hypothetical protein
MQSFTERFLTVKSSAIADAGDLLKKCSHQLLGTSDFSFFKPPLSTLSKHDDLYERFKMLLF